MSFDDLSEYDVRVTKENAIMQHAKIYLVETRGTVTTNGTSSDFDDVMLIYKVGRRIYKDWVFRHPLHGHDAATIYLQRERGCRSIEDVYRTWEQSAENMKQYISNFSMQITRIDE